MPLILSVKSVGIFRMRYPDPIISLIQSLPFRDPSTIEPLMEVDEDDAGLFSHFKEQALKVS